VDQSVVIALMALVPTVTVPTAMFLDARREHRRLSSEIAALEAQLDRLSMSGTPPLGRSATKGGAPTPQGLEP
jgi:hypothetical protein